MEIHETVRELVLPGFADTAVAAKPSILPFAHLSDRELLSYGVPPDWLQDVRQTSEDALLDIASHLPAEASEALLEIAVGGIPHTRVPETPAPNPFEHPDALRRFRLMANVDELQRALDFPWDKWMVFLHPDHDNGSRATIPARRASRAPPAPAKQ